MPEHIRFFCNNAVAHPNTFVKGKFAAVWKDERGWVVTVEESESNVKKDYLSRWIVDASGRTICVARKVN